MPYQHAKVPAGDKIAIKNGKLQVPDRPIMPFIEGDGTPLARKTYTQALDAGFEVVTQ